MKKLLYIVLLSMASVAYGQTKTAKVTLKNGTVLVGEIKNFDPLKQITLVIAGNPVELQMSDILRVEQNSAPTSASTTVQGPYTDQGNYPDSIRVKLGEYEITLLLVRGGDFMMGYDGRHSLSMNSEPVHKVRLTTYYISENLISNEQYATLAKLDFKEKYKTSPADVKWDVADTFMKQLRHQTGKNYRLPTDAEWEYASNSALQNRMFSGSKAYKVEWCSDFFDDFPSGESPIDPQGPATGNKRVQRSYAYQLIYNKYDRSLPRYKPGKIIFDKCNFRIVIKAADLSR